jgi:hypothetical protein
VKWPATCKVITQQYGVKNSRYVRGYHTGLDIGCKAGSPIYAAHDGRVTFAGWKGAYGNTVEISANSSLMTSYHHMSQVKAIVGQNVSAGTVIGFIGSTGQSTGPHLHFEVRKDGKDVNPNPYLDGSAVIPVADGTQTGIGDVFSFPGQMLKVFETLTDTTIWLRIGMVILGAVLLLMTFVGMAKTKVLGKSAASAVTGAVKKVGNAKS